MHKSFLGLLFLVLFCSGALAQMPDAPRTAANSIQPSPAAAPSSPTPAPSFRELKIRAGTQLDIESTHLISSLDTRLGDLLSFRVLVPVKIDNNMVIEQNALVTARVVKAKKAGHWGKAGKLAWVMQDVVAVDLTRVPLTAQADVPAGEQRVTGTSHGAEVATKTVVLGALLAPAFPIAPLALMSGFRRGENAVIPEGKRFVVYVQADTTVRLYAEDK
jgi:hypothetical protein